MPKVFDVGVLGLGAMGSASAFQLAKRGKRVLGIDQFSPPHAFGSSHGATRVTRQAIGEGEQYVPLVLRSYELWPEIEAAASKQLLSITGGLIMASERSDGSRHGSNRFLDQTIMSARKFGIDHCLLDTDEIRSRFPQFNLVGDERGYYEPMMGFLRPEMCIESQLGLAENLGAEIHRNERVLEFTPTPNVITVRTSAGEYRVGQIVVSAGSWIASLLPEFASWFKVQRQVLFWFELKDSIDAYLPGKLPVFIWEFGQHHDDFMYGFPAIDGVAGGIKVASEQRAVETNADTADRVVKEQEVDQMYRKYVSNRLPGLSSRCVNAVTCLYTSLPDSGFIIDFHPQYSNVVVVSPCSGHGFKHSAAIGEAVAELIIHGKSTMDLSAFRIARLGG
ncbi:MAG TPA: N-methyl-L-tryptophan oxidase [Candidatus Binatia bacterium]|jgi:sarcosine oxidase